MRLFHGVLYLYVVLVNNIVESIHHDKGLKISGENVKGISEEVTGISLNIFGVFVIKPFVFMTMIPYKHVSAPTCVAIFSERRNNL
ncbi:hypothetical protein U27_04601 [Candidatus Vecturithrix granuli]|uniref:Uncharacterized protein n=1 Tax=Vecturithrix granuli TaxID=1499967 RepID=A0A081BZ79_VECG1|nr:hypothetical protein U27_04601 [Candidatus Vecturithrix granuli]